MAKKNTATAIAKRDKELSSKSLAVLGTMISNTTPNIKKLKKLTRPTLIKPNIIPIGATVSGEILAVQESISKRDDMKDAKLLLLRNFNNPENPVDFLLPITGVIKAAVGGFAGAEKLIGQTLFIVRNPDGETTKYGGTKKVYMFDVYLQEK